MRLLARPFLLLKLNQPGLRRSRTLLNQPLRPILRRPATPLPRAPVRPSLRPQTRNPRPSRPLPSRKTPLPPERAPTRRGLKLRPVHRNLLQINKPLTRQNRNALAQNPIQKPTVLRPEVAQTVIVHRNTTAQPTIRNMAPAQTRKLARRPDPVQRRIKPKRQYHMRIRRRTARNIVPRLDPGAQLRKIKTLNKTPDNTSQVIRLDQTLKIHKIPMKLRTIRINQPGTLAHKTLPSMHQKNESQFPKSRKQKQDNLFTGSFAGMTEEGGAGNWGLAPESLNSPG